MTAAAVPRLNHGPVGLRPFNPRRDMAPLADLLELCFAGQLDAAGKRMVREMRSFGRAGWLGWLFSRVFLPPAAFTKGFVWEEHGRLVGNASLMRVERYRRRWVLSNVAVHPDYRRRGIGRRLTEAALGLAREFKGELVLLQVESEQTGIQSMYRGLGFRPLCTRTIWHWKPQSLRSTHGGLGRVRLRQPHEWVDQRALAQRLHPEGLIWPYPLSADFFRARSFGTHFGLETYPHWVLREGGCLLGSLSIRPGIPQRTWRMILLVEPEHRGSLEQLLLEPGLKALPSGHSAVLDYAQGVAQDVFRGLGFNAQRTLTWMALDLASEGAVAQSSRDLERTA